MNGKKRMTYENLISMPYRNNGQRARGEYFYGAINQL